VRWHLPPFSRVLDLLYKAAREKHSPLGHALFDVDGRPKYPGR